MYFRFELKKFLKRKEAFVLLLIAVLISSYVNFYVVKQDGEHSFIAPIEPYMEVYMQVMALQNAAQEDEEAAQLLDSEFLERWAPLSEMDQDLYEWTYRYRERLKGNASHPPNYAYPEDLDSYEQTLYQRYRDLQALMEDYDFIQADESMKSDIEWILTAYEQSQATGAHLIGNPGVHYNGNVVQRTIFQSPIFFGAPFFLIFLCLFAGIFVGERERGTLTLLYLQPKNRKRIITAKLGILMFAAVLYLVFVLLVQGIIALIIGLPLDGLKELYRVLTPDPSVTWMTGGELLLKIILAYLLMALCLSSLILFVSSRMRSTIQTLIVLLFLAVLNFTLVENIPAFQSPFNPIHQMDYLRLLIGKMVYESTGPGVSDLVTKPAVGLFPYLSLLLYALIFFGLSLLPTPEKKEKVTERDSPRSFFGLECRKIFRSQYYAYVLFGGFIFLAVLFIFPYRSDLKKNNAERSNQSAIQREQQSYDKVREMILGFESIDPENMSADEEQLLENALKEWQESLDAATGRFEALNSGDTKAYYANSHTYYRHRGGTYIDIGIEGGEVTAMTDDETLAILAAASETDDPIIPLGSNYIHQFFSAREDYKTPLDRERIQRFAPPSHSAVYWPYRLLTRQHLDVILLLLSAIVVFAGYTLDKESGNQIEFLLTQPLSKVRLHVTKLGASLGMSALLATCYLAFAALCGLLTEGVGAYRFPIVFYAGADFTLIPLWQYLLMVFGALFLQAFFLSSLILLLSIAIDKRVTLLGITAGIMGVGIVGTSLLPQGWFKTLSPFNYFEATSLANQAVRYANDLPEASYGLGIAVLFVFGLIFNGLGIWFISRREFKPAD